MAFLGTLLTIGVERRLTRWTMGAAAVSATALVTAAVVASLGVAETVRLIVPLALAIACVGRASGQAAPGPPSPDSARPRRGRTTQG